MRYPACFLLLLCGSSALTAAETWRWVDANGVVHYSDVPTAGAERVDLGSRVSRPTAPQPSPGIAVTVRDSAEGGATQAQSYARCAVQVPANDEVFQNVRTVPVSIALEPTLQGGHRLEVRLNGTVISGWPAGAASHTLTEMNRGSYTISARIVDAAGTVLCSAPPSTFHVRLPSILSPARQGAARP